MSFISTVEERAKKSMKTIILPEATDIRVLEAAVNVTKNGVAKIILIGDEGHTKELAEKHKIDLEGIRIINPKSFEHQSSYAKELYKLRKDKGMTLEMAKALVKDGIHLGMMLVKMGEADGLVCGAIHSTADTLRPALQILKTKPGTKIVSGFFIMDVPNCENGDIFVFSDCGINPNPNSEELSEIAIESAKSYEMLVGKTPKVAMLSYSTYGSAKSEHTKKVVDATLLAKIKAPELQIDGELQLDAAIVPEVAEIKASSSNIAGICNTLIFPNLDSGNIGYKLVQRMANAKAYGPLCQGIAKPVNDLSRGCDIKDIEGVIAITAVQAAQEN